MLGRPIVHETAEKWIQFPESVTVISILAKYLFCTTYSSKHQWFFLVCFRRHDSQLWCIVLFGLWYFYRILLAAWLVSIKFIAEWCNNILIPNKKNISLKWIGSESSELEISCELTDRVSIERLLLLKHNSYRGRRQNISLQVLSNKQRSQAISGL